MQTLQTGHEMRTLELCCSPAMPTHIETDRTKMKKKASSHELCVATNVDIALLGIFVSFYNMSRFTDAAGLELSTDSATKNATDTTDDSNAMATPYAVLFPW
jgi:hypothetical protein